MLSVSVWRATLGVDAKTVVEGIDYDEDADAIVASVRPRRATKRRCGRCGARASGYDRGDGRRRWRALDLGPTRCYLEAEAVRVTCAEHGVVAAQVPWAAHGARHTTGFEVLVAWLVVRMSKTAVKALLRVSWDTVGAIVDRVVARDRARAAPFAGWCAAGSTRSPTEGAPLHDGRPRPRVRPAGVGQGRPRPGHPAGVLRRGRPRAVRPDQAGVVRRGRVDR